MEDSNEQRIRSYLKAIEAGTVGGLDSYFAPDVVQREYPNRLVPQGKTKDLAELRREAERGQKVLRGQRFTVRQVIASGDHVSVEADWVGTLAMQVGQIPVGGEMKAAFAMFFTFRDGLITSQHNYDCFEPF